MALKFIINDPVEVPGPLRDHYTKADDGKYHLSVEGHPDSIRVREFRESNIAANKKLAEYEGLDPVAARAALAKVAAGEDEDVVQLKLDLAQEKSARAAAQAKADGLVLREKVGSAFIAIGGVPEAVDYMVGKAPFMVVDGELKPKPGETAPTVEE